MNLKILLQLVDKFILQRPNFLQFLKFSFVGIINTIIDFVVYFLLTRGFAFWAEHYLWAQAVSFALAVTNSFIWNSRWTFNVGKELKFQMYWRFFATNIFTFILIEITLGYMVEYLGVFDLFAKIMAIIVSVIMNFFASRYFVFKK